MGRTTEHERTRRPHGHKCTQDSMGVTRLRASWQKWKRDEHEPFHARRGEYHVGWSPNSVWSWNTHTFWTCFLSSSSSKPLTYTTTAGYLWLVYIQYLLDSVLWWGTMITSHVAGGTLPWQFPSPDSKIFWPFSFSLKWQESVSSLCSF